MNDLGTITLETERLILRRFKIEDAENMYNNWASDEKVCRYVTWDVHESVEVTKQLLENWIKEYDDNAYKWAVELKDTHEIIGNISVVHIHKKDLNAEIGYCYGSKYWGRGYATEALRRVIEFLLNDCNLYLVEAKHIGGNPASGRVMEKAGMKKEATLRDRMINKVTKKFDNMVYYSIIKDEL